MPRKSTNANPEGSPVTRRQSARIAAAQAASPVKSPMKSPRRKRQSNDATKNYAEDTESQQSQVNSEVTGEEMNGVETSSSTKDPESLNDSLEVPPQKKSKVENSEEDGPAIDKPHAEEKVLEDVVNENSEAEAKPQPSPPADFEVVEHSAVPPHDSEEVKAAISAQGEDGQLLVGFVQVDKEELPAANSVEIKQITASLESEHQSAKPCEDVVSDEPIQEEVPTNPVNGNGLQDAHTEEKPQTNGDVQDEIHQKVVFHSDDHVQSIPAPAAGDTIEVAPDSSMQ